MAPLFTRFWKTQGLTHYRAGQWADAASALRTAIRLNRRGDGASRFLLAMTQWQLGDRADARRSLAETIAWMREHRPNDPELIQLRAEAELLLHADEWMPNGLDAFAPH